MQLAFGGVSGGFQLVMIGGHTYLECVVADCTELERSMRWLVGGSGQVENNPMNCAFDPRDCMPREWPQCFNVRRVS